MTIKVTFEANGGSSSTAVGGPLILVPAGVRELRHSAAEIVLGPAGAVGIGSSGPDVVVGLLPLVYRAPKGPEVEWLWISPPSPFADEDIGLMWREIAEEGCMAPRAALAQGRYPEGRVAPWRSEALSVEFVALAHRRCRQLLASWPMSETAESFWRDVELRGGREDFGSTERSMAAVPIAAFSDRLVPQRTVRRRGSERPWQSTSLHLAAEAMVRSVRGTPGSQSAELIDQLIPVFRTVADTAKPQTGLGVDPPVSTWPVGARLCYEGLLAALAAIKAAPASPHHAPLSHLWRLYEAWTAACTMRVLRDYFGRPPLEGSPALRPGCEWFATWRVADDTTLTLYAHPHIGSDCTGSPNEPLLAARSVLSDLIPDAMVAVRQGSALRLVVLDAKRRSGGTTLDPAAVSEAASKYVWGVRHARADGHGEDELPVASAIIASSAVSGEMHSAASRIDGITLLPGRSDALREALHRTLTRLISAPATA